MRKSREETAKTRQRIISVASREFRRHGINGVGLADVMRTSGLTLGAFYRHFKSKDDLVLHACLDAMVGGFEAQLANPSQGTIASAIKYYLSNHHRTHAAEGCPIGYKGSELARADQRIRKAVTKRLEHQIEHWANQLSSAKTAATKNRAMVSLSLMVGALTISRVVTDRDFSDAILGSARTEIERIADEEKPQKLKSVSRVRRATPTP